ncbi:MAG: diaminopimelate decarboxylase [Deltaproteobacteria bacterium]|nr:diaminopimelate decarboxylase [Deltaproteobacteria bacterium]MCL5276379.1 diaminopimelate decarboxylase [Deltaproteobacteria bacterium]
MNFFNYRNGELYCEDVKVRTIAGRTGTPVYIYSTRTLRRHYDVFKRAFAGTVPLICYSVKANPNIAIISLFSSMGAGADIVSGGELFRAVRAGVEGREMVYSGVGKTAGEIRSALKNDILMFNAESLEELDAVDAVAGGLGLKAPVSIRINPDIDPRTHPYISTGLKKNKFGIDIRYARDAYVYARSKPNLKIVGVDMHIGSQLTDVSPIVSALRRVLGLVRGLGRDGIDIRYMDIGGGLGITYKDEQAAQPDRYAGAIEGALKGFGVKLILEPGRVLVGNAGILATKVLYRKQNGTRRFMIVDAGMNDLIRPSLYDAYHEILPVIETSARRFQQDVVGPICESGDFFAHRRSLPLLERGQMIAVMSAGAYGFSMSSNYNSRKRAAEVLVDGEDYYVIRKRETDSDLTRGERIPSFIKVRSTDA